ncbi:hypothetical protein BX616_001785, partial [Lobosporangium transversale]
MNSEDNKSAQIEEQTNRSPAHKVGGMRVPAADHPVPVVRKEHDRKQEAEPENEEERQLQKSEQFEYEKQSRMAEADRQAKMYSNQPKHDPKTDNFRQNQNIQVNQPARHNHI